MISLVRSLTGSPDRRRAGLGRRLAALVGLVLLVSSCADDAQQTILEPEGPAARKIDTLTDATLLIAAVVFVLVEVGVLVIVWKFRSRRGDDTLPTQLHGNTKLEIGWTAIPTLILAGLAVFTVATTIDLADEPEGALRVRVVGQQWWWAYDYDIDGDGVFADSDARRTGVEHPEEYATDIETATDLVIPVGRPVFLDITSRDVIHSYWIPALNGKRDAVPGRIHHLTLEADEPGTYVGQCTEYCGLSHAYMHQRLIALPEAEYEAWVESQTEQAEEPDASGLAAQGQTVFAQKCTSCHLVEGVNDEPNEDLGIAEGFRGAAQTSGAAPNLTHFASRGSYAGGIFDLWRDLDDDGIVEFEEIGEELETTTLEAWLRNPPGEKPLSPLDNRGMPNLGLSEAEIDALVAYLSSLK